MNTAEQNTTIVKPPNAAMRGNSEDSQPAHARTTGSGGWCLGNSLLARTRMLYQTAAIQPKTAKRYAARCVRCLYFADGTTGSVRRLPNRSRACGTQAAKVTPMARIRIE